MVGLLSRYRSSSSTKQSENADEDQRDQVQGIFQIPAVEL